VYFDRTMARQYHVVDNVRGIVVDRAQERLGQEVLGHLDRVEDLVEGPTLVDKVERLLDDGLEEAGGGVEGLADTLLAKDGRSVAGQEELGVELEHFAQGDGPLARVPLGLLRVAAVGRGPDEEVAGAEDLLLGEPDPGRVVRLALVVVQVKLDTANGERRLLAVVGPVGDAVLGRKLRRQKEKKVLNKKHPRCFALHGA